MSFIIFHERITKGIAIYMILIKVDYYINLNSIFDMFLV
jgi:hypothetical protein